jgi:uncharacterized integral membrane protein
MADPRTPGRGEDPEFEPGRPREGEIVEGRTTDPEREEARAADRARSAERKREVDAAREHGRHTGVSRTATGDPVIEHTGFRLSWGAIFAGLVIATVLQIVFMLGGMAVGFAVWSPGDSPEALGIATGVWLAVAMIASLFVGGLTTGRMAGILTPGDGAIHGVIMWGLSMLLTVWLAVAGVTGLLGGALDLAAGPVAAEVVADVERAEAEELGETVAETVQRRADRVDPEDATRAAAEGAGWALLAMGLGVLAAAGGAAVTARD